MSRIFQAASLLAIGATALVAAIVSVPVIAGDAPSALTAAPVVDGAVVPDDAALLPPSKPLIPTPAPAPESVTPRPASLVALVAATPHSEPEDSELRCLAAGIYFESRGEPLEGQLAVAHVILNRASSGRFATSACAVLTQPGQFSFVRRGVIPVPSVSATWRTAVAIARIAQEEQWHSPAPGALFFHARHVSPGWGRPVVARLGNHVFYR